MQAFRLATFLGVGLALWETGPLPAQWLGKSAFRKSQPAAPANQGFAGYIRRLTADANAAAQRGDLQTARSLAERAHKLSVTCQQMLRDEPDCSPEAMAALVRQYSPAAEKAPAAAPPVVQAVPPADLDLQAMLDTPSDSSPLIPPAPVSRPRHAEPKPQKPKPQKSSPTSLAKTERSPAAERPADSAPPAAVRPSDSSVGFLTLQTDWLAPNADATALVDQLANRPAQTISTHGSSQRSPSKNASSKKPSELAKPKPAALPRKPFIAPFPTQSIDDDDAEPVDDPEVTTAIGRAAQNWELDVSESFDEFQRDSAPQLGPQALPDDSAGEPLESRLGVWSNGAGHTKNVVTLSDFLDPTASFSGRSPSSFDHEPRMIETDFRRPAAAPIPAESVPAAPAVAAISVGSPETIPAEPPSVSFRDAPALEWFPATSDVFGSEIANARPLRLALGWSQWTAEHKAVVTGITLLTAGLILFGLSFRWT